MIVLSTAFKRALIGIEIGDKIDTFELDSNCKHSENLLLSIDNLLNKMGKTINDNDCYGVVIGPGSFTGVRIATSLVKGLLAGDNNKKIITLTSFELMAYTYINLYKPKSNFACVIDALSDLYFVCSFDKEGNKIDNEKMIGKEEFEKIQITKVGLEEENLDCQVKITPSAQDLLDICKRKSSEGKLSKPEDILPLYLRKSQAEASLEERLKKNKNF